MLINLFLGVILLLITYYIHTNTKSLDWDDNYSNIKIKRIYIILIIIVAFIPVFNLIMFTVGLVGWIIPIICGDIVFKPNSKVLNRILNYLKEEV